jgi:hypothetical protein
MNGFSRPWVVTFFGIGVLGLGHHHGTAQPVSFLPPGGVYTNFVVIGLKASNSPVRFTLDGTEPTPDSRRFAEAFLISTSTVVHARAFPRGQAPGPVRTASYQIVTEDIAGFSSDLPLVIVDTLGQAITNRQKIAVQVAVIGLTNGRSSLRGPGGHLAAREQFVCSSQEAVSGGAAG